MHIIDICIFVAYFIGIVLFGSSFYRKNKSSSAFTLGNNNIPTWVISMSIFATFVSSISYLALPGQAYQSNWNAFAFSLSLPFASFMAVKFFVPLYRSINSPSAYTYLEMRFGPWAKIYVSVMYLLTQLMRTGTILFLLALTLNVVLGWSMITVIIITGLSVMIYSLLGGIQAVVWTDAIQGIILISGAVVCAFVLLFSMPEGPGQLFQIAVDNHKFSLGSFKTGLTSSTFWVVLIYGIFINLQNFGIDQNYVQRYLTASSEKEAKKSALYGGLLYVPVSFLFLFIGTSLFSYYSANPGILPAGIQPDRVFPFYIINNLPVGLTGLLIASIFAAGMSTISTSVNSSATVILNDYFRKSLKDKNAEKISMKILYTSSFLFSIFSILIAIAMINVQSALDTWWKLASIFSGGMLGLFLLGYFSKKVNNIAAITGVITGVIVIGWMSLSPLFFTSTDLQKYASPFHSYLSIVFGTMAIFITGFLIGYLINKLKIRFSGTRKIRMIFFFAFIFVASSVTAIAQNCSMTGYGNPAFVPINDIGSGTWNGFKGGLYPDGSNFIPAGHKYAGLQLASQIQPLDVYGNPDHVNGKIVFISVGMSNTTMAFSTFIPMANADGNKNPAVKIVDCAEGGMSSDIISIVNAKSYQHYWETTVVNRLNAAGVTAKQVQVIWYKEAFPVGSPGPTPQKYSDSLIIQSKRIMNIIKTKFPNTKICYIASRIYAGYATSSLNPEPYSYWQGWSMKWMIEGQINNDPMLRYSGENPNSPWLCWGTYNWANGTIPRSDGLTWICPTDFNSDGTHPSLAGRQKVASRLLNFLDNDTTACWYRVGGCSDFLGINDKIIENSITVYPIPANGQLTFSETLDDIVIYNILGQPVLPEIKTASSISVSGLNEGIYFIRSKKTVLKFIVQH